MSPEMPQPKLFSATSRDADVRAEQGALRIGAAFVAAMSISLLGGALLLVRPRDASSDRYVELVPDSQGATAPIVAGRTVVTGRIFDANGDPVAGIAVRVRSHAQPGWDWVASSGSDGAFRVEGVIPGRVHVEAHDVEAGFAESALLEADAARHVVLVFDRTIDVTGAVLDERGGPVPRAAVKGAGRLGAPDRVVVTDEDGRFKIRAGPRSFERLIVWAAGFEATTVFLGDLTGAVVRRDVRLRAARPLHGTVVAPSGEPVAFARVSACAGRDVEVATTDALGAFELPATVIGCWLNAYHARFAASRGARISDRREIVVRLGAGGAIEGTAVDERGKPVGLFSVTIASFEAEEGAPGAPTRAGETGEHLRGTFRLDDLAPGTYVLRVHADGKVDTDSPPIEVGKNRVVRGARLVLTSSEVGDDAPSEIAPEPAETAAGSETAASDHGTESADEPAASTPEAPPPPE
jgi:hypothetical protein